MNYEVIIDEGETPNKCTIAQLGVRSNFFLYPVVEMGGLGPLKAPVLLHPEGVCLTQIAEQLGSVSSVACIDCVWPRLKGLLSRVVGGPMILARIPDGFVTAYPRHSKIGADPEGGLATIEALFIAAAILGDWDPGLLSDYYFGRQFVERNASRFLELGIKQAANPNLHPVFSSRPRHSLQRRRDRGKY